MDEEWIYFLKGQPICSRSCLHPWSTWSWCDSTETQVIKEFCEIIRKWGFTLTFSKLVYTHRYLANHKAVCAGSHFIHMQTDFKITKRKNLWKTPSRVKIFCLLALLMIVYTRQVCLPSIFDWIDVFMSLSLKQQLLNYKSKPSHRTLSEGHETCGDITNTFLWFGVFVHLSPYHMQYSKSKQKPYLSHCIFTCSTWGRIFFK